MADAAGVRLGQVMRVSDLSSNGGATNYSYDLAGKAALPEATQIPVGELDIQVTVEVDFAIG
jgi:uncharacterized protein YggE